MKMQTQQAMNDGRNTQREKANTQHEDTTVMVCRDITPRHLVNRHEYFRETHYLHVNNRTQRSEEKMVGNLGKDGT